MERDVLRTMLAEANTGLELQEIEPASEEFMLLGIFQDRYLLEPADSDHPPDAPIDEDTLLQPTAAGRELPFVGMALERWLNACPSGRRKLDAEAGELLGPLLTGWSSMVVHTIAGGPLSAAEVTAVLQVLDLDRIENRMALMEEADLLRRVAGEDGEPRFEATEWLCRAIAPLAAAARMEHRFPPGDTAPIGPLDVEAALRLTLPLLKLPGRLAGSCSLAVELDEGVPGSPAGVTARIEAGRVVACEAGIDPEADAWASAPVGDWLDTVIERGVKRVRSGGEEKLAHRLLGSLHETLFG
jgi:hypothetical protein